MVQRPIHILDQFPHYRQIENWLIVGQQFSIAIEDQAATGWHILRMEPIVIGPGGKIIVLIDLKIDELRHQRQKQEPNK